MSTHTRHTKKEVGIEGALRSQLGDAEKAMAREAEEVALHRFLEECRNAANEAYHSVPHSGEVLASLTGHQRRQ